MDTQANNRANKYDGMLTAWTPSAERQYDHASTNVPAASSGSKRMARVTIPTQQSLQEYLADTELSTKPAIPMNMQIPGGDRQEEAKQEATHILPIVQEAARFLRATIPANIAIETTLDPALPAVMLDGTYIHQVLINLCTNAVHAMQGAGGRLGITVVSKTLDVEAVRHIPDLKAGRYAMISVSDTGHGMDYETQQHIFDPFFTTKKVGEGTGLGLFIVHYIVMKYGGSISVSSELRQGTTFTVYLPAVETESPRAPRVSSQGSIGCRKHVLFIDDDYLLVQLGTRKLQLLNYVVSGFQRPEEALQMFRDNPYQFDAVIMDHYMPSIDGHELAREMLSLRPNLPIIMLSGYIRPDDAERVRQLGVRRILSKSDALRRIDEVLYGIIGPSQAAQRAVSIE